MREISAVQCRALTFEGAARAGQGSSSFAKVVMGNNCGESEGRVTAGSTRSLPKKKYRYFKQVLKNTDISRSADSTTLLK